MIRVAWQREYIDVRLVGEALMLTGRHIRQIRDAGYWVLWLGCVATLLYDPLWPVPVIGGLMILLGMLANRVWGAKPDQFDMAGKQAAEAPFSLRAIWSEMSSSAKIAVVAAELLVFSALVLTASGHLPLWSALIAAAVQTLVLMVLKRLGTEA
jgi:hypothetical protein